MNIKTWLTKNTSPLTGKTVTVTGATGGIGRELCTYLAELGADLVLADRNPERSNALRGELQAKFPDLNVRHVRCDLADIASVKSAARELAEIGVDVLIHNAGAYSIPRMTCASGLDNVFQINFASPYYLTKELLPSLRQRGGRVVAVGSVAHNYSKTDPADVDFATRSRSSLAYGNAKRHLMFALYGLFEGEHDAHLAVTHPGITFTNITAHYPPLIFAIIKHPMKVIFMKPRKAALSILRGVFEDCDQNEWIGPRLFDVWGFPRKRALTTCTDEESRRIFETAERVYREMCDLYVK